MENEEPMVGVGACRVMGEGVEEEGCLEGSWVRGSSY